MKRQAGFTVVEIAIVVIISGLLLAAAVAVLNSVDKRAKNGTTIQRMETIMDAMSAFASRNYRIPCPADPSRPTGGVEPFGSEDGGNAAGTAIGVCSFAARTTDGIVPFATLQLSEEDVQDGWGNYITYKVNADFAADPENANTDIHALCRTSEWIEAGRNKAAEKARFCCNGENRGEDLAICQDSGSNTVALCNAAGGRIWPFDRDLPANWYVTIPPPLGVEILANPNLAADPISFTSTSLYYQPDIYDPVQINIETIAYALISHGPNESGAFLNTGGRIDDTNGDSIPDVGGTHEILNANNTQLGVWSLEKNDTNGAARFDDIVRFSTQGMTLARLRKDSCAVP